MELGKGQLGGDTFRKKHDQRGSGNQFLSLRAFSFLSRIPLLSYRVAHCPLKWVSSDLCFLCLQRCLDKSCFLNHQTEK